MSSKETDSSVSAFLRRVVELANTEITPYGTLNPWKASNGKTKRRHPRPIRRPAYKAQPCVPSGLVTLEGKIGVGQSSPYAIDGQDIFVNSNTMVVGDLLIGATARVKVGAGGRAKSVVVTASSDGL